MEKHISSLNIYPGEGNHMSTKDMTEMFIAAFIHNNQRLKVS